VELIDHSIIMGTKKIKLNIGTRKIANVFNNLIIHRNSKTDNIS